MGLPKVNIIFKQLAASAIQRGSRGIIALPLKDTSATGTYEIINVTDIPTGLSAANKKQIELALMGGVNAPLKVLVRVASSTLETDWVGSLNWLETIKFDYVVFPDIQEADKTTIASWVKSQRDLGKKIKAILPNHVADTEGVINFTTTEITVGGVEYTPEQYCSRMAGLIAGTPLTMSTTFQPLPEVESVRSYSKTELDTAIDNGELVVFHDGEKVKVARGVNSLKTTTADKGESFKKIKIVDILDLYFMDITKTINDNYIGKYPNSYDNKVLLLTAIQAYHRQLEADQLFDPGKNNVGIDINAQRNYLMGKGVDVGTMNEQEIKIANTDDQVFIQSNIKPLDAMEDIAMKAYI